MPSCTDLSCEDIRAGNDDSSGNTCENRPRKRWVQERQAAIERLPPKRPQIKKIGIIDFSSSDKSRDSELEENTMFWKYIKLG